MVKGPPKKRRSRVFTQPGPKAEVLRSLCNSARSGGLRYFTPAVVAAISKTSHLFRKVTPLAAGTTVSAHVFIQPDEQGATRLQRRVVVFPVGRSVLRFC
jgi:hypothetical protein